MKKLLLLLLIPLTFISSANASEKEVTLARECIEKIKSVDPNRKFLPKKYNEFSYYPLRNIRGSSGESGNKSDNYCKWFGVWTSDAIYGSSSSCAWGSLEAIKIKVTGKNRFNEEQQGVFDCAFRGSNYEIDGIRVVSNY